MGNCCSRAGTYAPEAPLDTKQHHKQHIQTVGTYSASVTGSQSCQSSVVDQSAVSKAGRASFESSSNIESSERLQNIRTSYEVSTGCQQYAQAWGPALGPAAESSSNTGPHNDSACTAAAVAAAGRPQQLTHESSYSSSSKEPCVGFHHTRSWCAPCSSASGGDGISSVGSAALADIHGLALGANSVDKQSSSTASILAAQQYSAAAVSTPGLTLLVSSHSNSSHQGSPRACGNSSSSSKSSSSSRNSSTSGHTAFASIPASVCPSGLVTPDSMRSALSTASSYISSGSSAGGCSSCCRGGTLLKERSSGGGSMLAAATTAAAVHEKCVSVQQQQQQQQRAKEGQLQQLTGSVHLLNSDSEDGEGHSSCSSSSSNNNTDRSSSAHTPRQQQQQQHVGFQGVHAELSSPVNQRPVFGSPFAAACGQQEERQPFWMSSGWSFGCHSDQNQRMYMEDRTVAIDLTGHAAFPPTERAGLFSVYDGHGGHQVAEFLADHVKDRLLSAGPDAIAAEPLRVLGTAVEDAERLLLVSYAEGDRTAAAGSTLCAVLLLDDKLHVAHVGDSRAVLARGSTVRQLTRDHKPACEIEARRILTDHPEAEITSDGYLYSELAVARAIGSAHLKRDPSKRALIATAEVTTVQLERQDDFVIVATDGLWDTISSSEAVSVARRVLSDTKDANATSRALVERAQRCGSSDNISVVMLLLHSRGIVVPRSNSRLFRRPTSQQLGDVSTDGSPRTS